MNATTTTPTVTPTTAQLIAAFADALAPFAGPYGIAADAVMHAGLMFLAQFQANKPENGVYTMADLEKVAAGATDALATLQASRAAQKAGEGGAATTARMKIPTPVKPGNSV